MTTERSVSVDTLIPPDYGSRNVGVSGGQRQCHINESVGYEDQHRRTGQTEFSKNSGRSELRLATEAILAALDDFAVGGQVEGGQFTLRLRSQTNSSRPRIVNRLDGHIVSLSRTFVQTVVTEYGVARLRGLSVRERAFALAEIAHPDDRAALRAEAENLM